MQKIAAVLLSAFFVSCCSTKSAVFAKNPTVEFQSACPENGSCVIVSNPGKSMVVLEDEYGNLHYNLQDDPSKNVVAVTYNRNVPKGVQDGTYREEVVFEYDSANKSTVIEGEALQNVKLLFGRFCYCKGQTGYYKINIGSLMISGDSEQRVFTLNFTNTQTPQVMSSLKFTVKS